MTIGEIYYLSTILDHLNTLFFVLRIILIIAFPLLLSCSLDNSVANTEKDIKFFKKSSKISGVVLAIVIILSIFIPNKKDFLIIAMTKNYTTQQVYTMTKDEIKGSIDYFVNQIKEIK